jgi:manganese transport protein
VLGFGLDPTQALVVSQVVLSFGIPFALIPLVIIASKRALMGQMVNPPWLTALASVIAAVIIALNLFLLQQVFFG